METGVELREGDRPARLTPTELAKLGHPTPYLLMDLDAVDRAYGAFNKALPDITIRYAVKCNPEERILRRLHAAGSTPD